MYRPLNDKFEFIDGDKAITLTVVKDEENEYYCKNCFFSHLCCADEKIREQIGFCSDVRRDDHESVIFIEA